MTKLAAGLALLAATATWAHHSASAEYDASKLLVLNGAITKVEWGNPHVYCHLTVKGPTGPAVDWYLEMGSPNGMRRQGWLPDTVKPGDAVTVEAFPAKDHSTLAKVHRLKVPDGRWLFADSSVENAPPNAP